MPLQDDELVKQTAQELRSAREQRRPFKETVALRAMRGALMLKYYTAGHTLEEVGDPFEITRERARQIITRLVGQKAVKRLPSRYQRSEKARKASIERGRQQRISGARQRHPSRNEEIHRLVAEGLTYSQVARTVGVSRNTVCAVMYRYKHRNELPIDDRAYPPAIALAS